MVISRSERNPIKRLGPLLSFTDAFRSPDNLGAYIRPEAVEQMGTHSELQPPEQAVLERLQVWLMGKRMLDVGVGVGRTTPYFAPIVASYVGIDYSLPMVESCTARLGDRFSNVSLDVGDVRDLGRFAAGSFDFVLFSYNGLDSIGHDDRLIALAELRRVTDTAGYICFSSHNLLWLDSLFRLTEEQRANPYRLARGAARQVVLRMTNESPRTLSGKQFAMVRDSSLKFQLSNYYVRPSEQVAQLQSSGLSLVGVYGLDGRSITVDEADDAGDGYLYYLVSPAA